jgi:tetratricopeptide (TPR) repeat protein
MGAFFYNSGNYDKADEFFNKIGNDSLYQPFILLKNAEKAGNFYKMRKMLTSALDKNPLFMPAILKLVDKNLQKGRENDALKVVNRALKTPDLTDMGRAFLLTLRTRIYRQSGDLVRADADITHAADLSPRDTGILAEQAQVWAESGQNLDEAYQIAMILLKKFPSDIGAWDTLAMIVWKKEGVESAISILQKIAKVAQSNSAMFEHLGDMYVESGDAKKAREAYLRALELSDDGQTSESILKKKIRKTR